MLHAVDRHHRIGVGRLPAGGDAAPLVDGDIDDHGTGLHLFDEFLAHQGRGAITWTQHCADDEVGAGNQPLQPADAAHQAHHPPLPCRLQLP